MMALQGCGQRASIGKDGAARGLRALAWAGALVLGINAAGGTAAACHIKPKGQDQAASTPDKAPAAEILNPTSLVNAPTPTPPPTPTPTTAPTVTATPMPPAVLAPSPLTSPPAADGIMPPAAAVSAHSSGVEPTCSCTCPPLNPPPISTDTNPPPPSNSGTQPPAGTNTTPSTPEPSTIVSALVMITAAVVARRRRPVA